MNKRNIFFYILISSLLFLFSCSNILTDNDIVLSDETSRSIKVTSENNIVNFASDNNARVISLENYNLNTDLDFYIWGQNITDSSLNIETKKIDITSASPSNPYEGAFSFNFGNYYYRLFLGAVPKGETFSQTGLVLFATTSVDLRYNNDIQFYLSYSTLEYSGKVEFFLYNLGWNQSAERLTAGIYKCDNNNTKVYEMDYLAGIDNYNSAPATYTPNFKAQDIHPGTYNFVATYKKMVNDKIKEYKYTDKIVVMPNRTTKAVIGIPDIIDRAPSAPTNLIAGYTIPETIHSEYYPVEFCWDDNSNNEHSFELEILDITSATSFSYSNYINKLLAFTNGTPDNAASMNSLWSSLLHEMGKTSGDIYTREHFENPNIWPDPDGSLATNSKYVVTKVLLGRKYLARIRAYNDNGYSDYAYLDIANTGNKAFETTNCGASFTSWATDSAGMNQFRITYELNGGKFNDDISNTQVTSQIKKNYFFAFQNSLSIQIMNPISLPYSGTDTATLVNSNNANWTKWKIDSLLGDDYSSTVYNGYENLTLYAVYDGTPAGNTQDISFADIIINGYNENDRPSSVDITSTINSTNNSITISKTNYDYIDVFLRNHENKFSNVNFKYCEQGSHMKDLITKHENRLFVDYNYASLKISDLPTENPYIFFIHAENEDTTPSFSFKIIITE